jgi:hypothetical protein
MTDITKRSNGQTTAVAPEKGRFQDIPKLLESLRGQRGERGPMILYSIQGGGEKSLREIVDRHTKALALGTRKHYFDEVDRLLRQEGLVRD